MYYLIHYIRYVVLCLTCLWIVFLRFWNCLLFVIFLLCFCVWLPPYVYSPSSTSFIRPLSHFFLMNLKLFLRSLLFLITSNLKAYYFVFKFKSLFHIHKLICQIVMLIIGVKESSMLNSIITLSNLAIVVLIIVCGSLKVDFSNWKLHPNVKNFKFFLL